MHNFQYLSRSTALRTHHHKQIEVNKLIKMQHCLDKSLKESLTLRSFPSCFRRSCSICSLIICYFLTVVINVSQGGKAAQSLLQCKDTVRTVGLTLSKGTAKILPSSMVKAHRPKGHEGICSEVPKPAQRTSRGIS